MSDRYTRFVREQTVPAQAPLVPELTLHLGHLKRLTAIPVKFHRLAQMPLSLIVRPELGKNPAHE